MYFDLLPVPAEQINPAVLAYLGDAVFELMTREYLLHEMQSSAVGQARAVREVLPMLDERELHHFKRGRNAALSVTKKANPGIHSAASGLETLMGALYLEKREDRLRDIFSACVKACLSEPQEG